jgi:hypothetical protein
MPQSLLGFGFRSHSDVAQARARNLREEALDQVEPRAVLRREEEAEAALSPSGEQLFGLLGHMHRLIVKDIKIPMPKGQTGSSFLRKPMNSRERWRSST